MNQISENFMEADTSTCKEFLPYLGKALICNVESYMILQADFQESIPGLI